MPEEPTLSLKRCAIYTRKSTNHLLDRDLNSLVTQREICTAYIASQRYRGWSEVIERYDDGGHSGSGLERPALARLEWAGSLQELSQPKRKIICRHSSSGKRH